uniref:Spindle pole body component 110-like n=1 Tax=Strongyloides papillosus TaxID=174720 RepID=A0A0N5C7X1_STREA
MLKNKRDSTPLFDSNFLTEEDYEEIYKDIDNVKNKGKKRAIAYEKTGIDRGIENGGSYYRKRLKANVKTIEEKAHEPERKITSDGLSLVDGITAPGQKDKRGSDVTSDDDVVDESNNYRLSGDTWKGNSINKSCHLSQSHSLETARNIDGMSSQGTRTSNNNYNTLMEKIEAFMNMLAELTEEIKEIKQKRRVVREKNDEIMYSKWNTTVDGKSVPLYSVSFSDKEEAVRTYRHHMIVR